MYDNETNANVSIAASLANIRTLNKTTVFRTGTEKKTRRKERSKECGLGGETGRKAKRRSTEPMQ